MAVKKMTPAQMKADKAMDVKGLTRKQDTKADKKLVAKIKKGR